jgi:antitoxin (DNA-binding transcriptional repressor) of toxin-antitoxin stability system
MSTVNIQDVERDPNAFFQRVEAGETFVVVRGSQPVAEVTPVRGGVPQRRPFGLAAGQFRVPDDFDDPLPEDIVREFEGR